MHREEGHGVLLARGVSTCELRVRQPLRERSGGVAVAVGADLPQKPVTHLCANAGALEDAEEFLLRVRSVLHLEAGRHHNILSHEVQERVSERLGYAGSTPEHHAAHLFEMSQTLLPEIAARWANPE